MVDLILPRSPTITSTLYFSIADYSVRRKYSKPSDKLKEETVDEGSDEYQGPLRVSVSMFSPFIFKDGDHFTGIDIDIWRLVSGIMGIDLEFKLAPHNAATASMVC